MRAARISLIVLAVIVGLFVIADRIAVQLAENQAAKEIQNREKLNERPSVSISGFPFLTQVAAKEFDEVEVELPGVTAQARELGTSLRIDRVSVQLRDVRLSNGYSTAVADRVTGTAHISYKDLTKAAPPGITVGYGGKNAAGNGQVRLTAHIDVLGFNLEESVDSTVSVSGGNTVRVRAEDVPESGMPGVDQLIRDRLDFDRRVGDLPSGMRLDRLEATEEDIRLQVTGTDVTLTS